jgi:ABC-type transporter Mla subunit MlaD
MTDSADIKSAKQALEQAVDSLEAGLGQLMTRMKTLEASANDSDAFREDRAKLAAQLDEMAAKAERAKQKLEAREAKFTEITQEGEAELERIMGVVRGALQKS